MSTQPIVRRKLADEVRDRLIHTIRSGELRPGDRLPSERDLMERFEVGRPAIREAMQSLASAGLIEISHGERARVAVPDTHGMFDRIGQTMLHLLQTSPVTLQHLKDARVMFEVGMVRMAAARASGEDIRKLRAALQHQRSCMSNVPEFVKADMAFHTAIAGVSGNSVCVLLSEAMLDWLFEFRRDLLRIPGSELITLAEHERLLDAIASHSEAEAEQAMVEHLTRASERYRILEDAIATRSMLRGTAEAKS
ncbi:MAG TPA: transcriptional regulator NanR [Bryobacteraceae bacterium]|nr:transcriptional regulator NanR [Bryobacteraceae bacterium]